MRTLSLPVAGPNRPRTVVVGALFATCAAFVAFASLITVYVQQRQQTRAAGGEWLASGSIEMGPAGMSMATLLLSAVTVQWAVQASRAEDRPHGFIALGLTLMFGVAVINQFWFIYQNTGFAIDAGVPQLMFYVVTGSFIAMLLGAMAAVTVFTLRSLLGPFGRELAQGVQAAAIFWHMMIVCYFLVWYIVFITK